ncbi:MAG: hypothetical protein WBA68_00615, partial [Alteraurantiacibacter sp.]
DPAHARHASRYDAALRERNKLLSDERPPEPAWIDSIEAQLASAGALLAQGRARLVGALTEELAAYPTEPFARPALALLPGGPLEEEALRKAFAQGRQRDRAAQRTLAGPHRDELHVTMEGKAMPAAECSTGEQKAMLIAITLAHATLAARGRPSLLLLDEVAAHLDPVRRDALFERLRASGTQVWLTGTEAAPFDAILAEAAVWKVSGGAAERLYRQIPLRLYSLCPSSLAPPFRRGGGLAYSSSGNARITVSTVAATISSTPSAVGWMRSRWSRFGFSYSGSMKNGTSTASYSLASAG